MQKTLYSSVQVRIPAPHFIIFYNGEEKRAPGEILKLSDAFEIHEETPQLELMVTMLNVNWGENKELMEHCKTLKEYSQYVEKVRTYAKKMEINDAVDIAVEESIKEGILAEFLRKNRAEVIQMSIFEYDEEKERILIREAEREYGRETGLAEGRVEMLVTLLYKNHKKGKSIDEICSLLDMKEDTVANIIKLINLYSDFDEAEIIAEIMKKGILQ